MEQKLKELFCRFFGHLPHGPLDRGVHSMIDGRLVYSQRPTYQCNRCHAMIRLQEHRRPTMFGEVRDTRWDIV